MKVATVVEMLLKAVWQLCCLQLHTCLSPADCLSLSCCQQEEVNRVVGPKPHKASMSGKSSAKDEAGEAGQYSRSCSNSAI